MSLDTIFATIEPATTSRSRPLVRSLADGRDRRVLGVSSSAVRGLRDRIEAYRSALPSGSTVYGALDRRLLVAESADLTARRRQAYLEGAEAELAQRIGELALPRAGRLTLTAREGEVPLTFLNRSQTTMTVVVRLASDKLLFPGGGGGDLEQQIELPPNNRTLRFKVRARTAGAFPLDVSLVSPRGGLVLASTRFTVRSTAVSGVGIGLSVGAGLFLLAWWGRHLVKGRRAKRLVPN
jgi:hypothetical protein